MSNWRNILEVLLVELMDELKTEGKDKREGVKYGSSLSNFYSSFIKVQLVARTFSMFKCTTQ
jgi:hypothetical protein